MKTIQRQMECLEFLLFSVAIVFSVFVLPGNYLESSIPSTVGKQTRQTVEYVQNVYESMDERRKKERFVNVHGPGTNWSHELFALRLMILVITH
jgi:hypothetical protein